MANQKVLVTEKFSQSLRCSSLCISSIDQVFDQEVAIRGLKICVVVFQVWFNYEIVLLVERERLLIVALHMKYHAIDLSCYHAVLDGFLEQFRCNAIPTVRFQHSDCHDIALFWAILQNVFLAADRTDKHVLHIRKLRIPLHRLKHIVEVLRVDDRKRHVIENAKLFKVFGRQIAKFDV